MTMVPAGNFSKQHHLLPHGGFYGYCGGGGIYTESFGLMSRVHGYDFHTEACLGIGSGLDANPMAEDESRTNSLNEAGSNSKDNKYQELELERDEGWLQLGIGDQAPATRHDRTARREGLIELDLSPGGGTSLQQARPLAPIFHMPEFRAPPRPTPLMHSFSASLFFQHQQQGSSSMFPYHEELSSCSSFRPLPQNIAAAPSASSSSSSSLVPFGSYFARPFPVQPEMDVRIIDPPRRPNSGIWFVLQASQNQAKEPFLSRIPKSYLRIKDGKMTVRSVMKYLVNKLSLDNESEVEIRCREEELQPCLTLQHVRDQIWSTTSRNSVALLPHTSTPTHHLNLMLLHYGRRA